MPRGDEGRRGAGRPIIIVLALLGAGVVAVLAIQIRLLLRGDRSVAHMDREGSAPALVSRDYEPSSLTAKMPGRPANARVQAESDEGRPPDEAMPPGPLSMTMSAHDATKFLLNREMK